MEIRPNIDSREGYCGLENPQFMEEYNEYLDLLEEKRKIEVLEKQYNQQWGNKSQQQWLLSDIDLKLAES